MNLFKSLFEADPKKKEDDAGQPEKKPFADPVKKKANPFPHLDDLDIGGGSEHLPSGPVDEPEGFDDVAEPEAPHMPQATGDKTRAKTSGISPDEHMRDMLGRIDMNQDDEIDDAEAARRAGLTHGDRPEPRPPGTDVARVSAAEVPSVLNNQLAAASDQMPEWHTINHLPGYMARAIRGMGRQFFGMFTNTPLESIMTIANVQGQGPNTDAEMRAVAGWLMQNGEDKGQVDIDMGNAIPGYAPDVREYSAMGVRFHVVRDPHGQYIYAYPEQDAVRHTGTDRIGGMGPRALPGRANTRLLNRESAMKPITTSIISESILAESLKSFQLKETFKQQYVAELHEHLLNESTLSKLIGKTPGGQELVRWLHARHQLSNTAEYASHPFSERVMWTEFKNHPDQFMIISASSGVAGIKPNEADIKRGYERAAKAGKEYNPARDNTLRYQIVAFKRGEQVDPALLRSPKDVERDADPTVMKARGGMISKVDTRNEENIFDTMAQQIGTLQEVYIAKSQVTGLRGQASKEFSKGYEPSGAAKTGVATVPGAVDRAKIAGRTPPPEAKPDLQREMEVFKDKLKPVLKPLFKRVGNLAMMDIKDEARDAVNNGDTQKANQWMALQDKVKRILVMVDTSGDLALTGWNNPISNLIDRAIREASGGQDLAAWLAELNRTPGVGKLTPFMDSLKSNLIKAVGGF